MYIGMLWGLVFGDWVARKVKAKELGLNIIRPRMKVAA